MPLVFAQPKFFAVDAAQITSIAIQPNPLQIVISYETGTVVGADLSAAQSGAEVFGADDLAAVDPNGTAYEAVKAVAYALLKAKLGAGTVT